MKYMPDPLKWRNKMEVLETIILIVVGFGFGILIRETADAIFESRRILKKLEKELK